MIIESVSQCSEDNTFNQTQRKHDILKATYNEHPHVA